MIRAGLSELRWAFHTHQAATPDPSPSQYLLLFYAAECGLKALWLSRNKLRTSEDFPEDAKSRGHDLMLWFKKLKLPANLRPTLMEFRPRRGRSERHHLSEVHQAWRYGVALDAQDEGKLVTWLQALCQRLKQELPT
jgi:hypothetical protein